MVYTTHLHKYGYISRYLVPSVELPMMAKIPGFDEILIDMEHSSFDLDEIAALDGVDSLLIGTNDLTAEMGIHRDYENPRVTEAYQRTNVPSTPAKRSVSGLALEGFIHAWIWLTSSARWAPTGS